MENEGQEGLQEDKALQANEVDAEPISDDEGVGYGEDLGHNFEFKASQQVESMLVEDGQPSSHSQTYEGKGETE